MVTSFWQRLRGNRKSRLPKPSGAVNEIHPVQTRVDELDIAPDDPLLPYLISAASAVEVESLSLQSPTLDRLRAAGVKIVVPLVSQGELIGLINLGPRRSEQDYSIDDRRLLNTLATQAAPALRVAQLARQQQAEARERERLEQELRVARIIQQTLLPKEVPSLDGWSIAAFWQPAREVGGDFYDFLTLPDGKFGILIADVTDKGVPAALVMATTRSLLRSTAERLVEPGRVLERTNELLHPDIPRKMFVTCLYLVFDPSTGELVFANAGHNLPYQTTAGGVLERRATGMPLGLMPAMRYEETYIKLNPGDSLLLTSDGLVEAHNFEREMFGFDRVKGICEDYSGEGDLIEILIGALNNFTGSDYEQEDDITLVTLTRAPQQEGQPGDQGWEILGEFELPSEPGNERNAAAAVLSVVQDLSMSDARRKRLETAVAEASMNAMEHGNHYNPELNTHILVRRNKSQLSVRIRDLGGGTPIPDPVDPDIDAKLAGLQSPRGWGLFIIKNMVDEMHLSSDATYHTIELILNLDNSPGREK